MMSRFLNPHISQPYNKIGFMRLLEKSICISIGKFRTLIFLRMENIARLACFAMCFLQLIKESLFAIFSYNFDFFPFICKVEVLCISS